MTSRRPILDVLKCMGMVLALVLAFYWFTVRTPFDRPHFDKLTTGMTRTEVETVLGGAARNEFREKVIVWLPQGDSWISYELRPEGPVSSFFPSAEAGSEERLWVGKEGLIAARFSTDGRLVEKYFSDVHVTPRPSVADFVRHVMGR